MSRRDAVPSLPGRLVPRCLAIFAAAVAIFAIGGDATAATPPDHDRDARVQRLFPIGRESLDGANNNIRHDDWGEASTDYTRVGRSAYADGISAMPDGPPARYISNRIFNDVAQNIFSENGTTQWAYTWGQFVDHTIGLEQGGTDNAPIAFDATDPLESFRNDLGAIDFQRTPGSPGSGVTTPRQNINTVSSYIDGWAVYGGSPERLEWLRAGPVDGDLSNNSAKLLLTPDGYLPHSDARGDVTTAPPMDLMGRLHGQPQNAVVAGDVRANENIALTSVQTLFAREHNRIVDLLPASLPEETKFDIARRVVTAEEQYITYSEFLPSLGVRLAPYRGYDPSVNASISNEFAVVGYRAHSMVHGEIESESDAADYSPDEMATFESEGVEVSVDGADVTFTVPLNIAFGNPDLVQQIGLGHVLAGIAGERQYKNDEQIDNQMRSVLFQMPGPDVADPASCLDGADLPGCFSGVQDLAALDIQRGRDHGMPSYNDLRRAYGLAPKRSFTAITGEASDAFPADPEVNAADPINDPSILDFTKLQDKDGNVIDAGSDLAGTDVVFGTRRTPIAARLKAIYGDVSKVDAFVGMVSEPHVRGTEFGELQLAMWQRQFQALRDGDRFFYRNDPALANIERSFGVSYRHSLADIIVANTEMDPAEVPANVFKLAPAVEPPAATATATAPASPATATPTATVASGATPTPWLPGYNNCGDVTGDGLVNADDARAEAKAINDGVTLAQFDVSRDGKVNYWDQLLILVQLDTRCRR